MNPLTNDGIEIENPELLLLINNKESGYTYRFRREEDWRENYTLSRDRPQINRLTQRQSVNIPLMKTTLRTLLKDIDDMPVIQYENLDNDKEAEIFKNEYWKYIGEKNKFEIQDIVDKKQVLSFGRSFDEWQIIDGMVVMSIVDPEDILVSRYTSPYNIHSSRFLTHIHIFVPLSQLSNNPDYDQEEVKKLQTFFGTQLGLIKAADNQSSLVQKNQKMADMGDQNIESPVLGETYVELSMHYVFRREEGETDDQIYVYAEAENMVILMKKKQEDIIGVTKDHYFRTHYRYCTWADDVEIQDFWSDSVADIVRGPNKVLNAWYSQLVENRTLRNFGMNYYNSLIEGFVPATFDPKPFGWYPVPGKPGDVFQKVDIPDLKDSLDEMEFVINLTEKATGAVASLQGVQQDGRQITLGEVKIDLTEAKERVKGMAKFYNQVWKERGEMFVKLVEAGADKIDAVKVYKKGRNTDNIYEREIGPDDWKSEAGYRVKVWSQEDKNDQDSNGLQKLSAAVQNMPGNNKLIDIYDRKLLEWADLPPDDITSVMDEQVKTREQMMMQAQQGMGAPQAPQMGAGGPPQLALPPQGGMPPAQV